MKLFKIFILILFAGFLNACSSAYYIKRADRMTKTGRYYKACGYYGKAYYKVKNDAEKERIARETGELYRKVNRLREASVWYKRALRYTQDSVCLLERLIETAHKRGEFTDAEKYLTEYNKIKGTLPIWVEDYQALADKGYSRYIIRPFDDMNSRYDDYAPSYENGDTTRVYFASTRRGRRLPLLKRLFSGGSKEDPVTGNLHSNIYMAEYTDVYKYHDRKGKLKERYLEKPRWQRAVPAGDTSLLNTRFSEAVVSFDANNMYFSSSRKTESGHWGVKIYTAKKTGDTWGNVNLLRLVSDTVSIAHPALSADGQRLYFVSDMYGGYGGNDIWYCEKEGSKWGKPINMGYTVNTKANEMFPYERDNGEFYFASDGHKGMGGLDIFKLADDEVVNLGKPFNSEADDFAIVFKPGLNEGLFSSSRGSRGRDNIYRFDYKEFYYLYRLNVVDDFTGEPIQGAFVKVVRERGREETHITKEDGSISLELEESENYIFSVYKDSYLKDVLQFSTKGITVNGEKQQVLNLKQMARPVVVPDIFYDFAKWEIKEESKKALDALAELLNNNPNVVIELSSHTDYIGDEEVNVKLSYKRAQAVTDYLVSKGINADRLVAKGYGESRPKVVNYKDEEMFPFLKKGNVLTLEFVSKLTEEQRDKANLLNRRTEFRVLRKDYKSEDELLLEKVECDDCKERIRAKIKAKRKNAVK